MEQEPQNPYSSAIPIESDNTGHSPFDLCYLPFVTGSWLIIAVATSTSVPTEPIGRLPFVGLNAILFSVLLMAPLIAFVTAFVSAWWVQFRLGKNDTRRPRRLVGFLAGVVAPIITSIFLSVLADQNQMIGESVNWIFGLGILTIYLGSGEFIVQLAASSPIPNTKENTSIESCDSSVHRTDCD